MYDLVSIGSLTIDLYFQGESLTVHNGRFELAYGGKYVTDHFHESLGGGATNVAIGVRRHGLAVTLKTTIGDNGFRSMVEQKLQEDRVSYIHSHFDSRYQSISCIIQSPKGDKTVLTYKTPHQHIFTSEREKRGLLRTKAVFMANMSDISFSQKVEVKNFFKRHEKTIFLNLGTTDCRRSREQVKELIEGVDVLIVNGHEYAELIKTNFKDVAFDSNLFHKLHIPGLKALIVTNDKKGSHGYTQDSMYYQVAIEPLRIIDSTGAGDGYTAGFIASYLKGHSIPSAMEAGARHASRILAKLGAN